MEERDPEFAAKAVAIIDLELHPPTDGPTFCVDEKTGIGVRRPAAPSQPVRPGHPARREFEYVRNGTADLLAAFSVRDGQVVGLVQTIHVILDPVSLHRSAEVAVWLAYRPWRTFVFHWLPTHASWLSFVEVWFSSLSRKCLKRSEFADFTGAEQALTDFIATYNAHQAHPFTWRKGIRFYQRLKDKLSATEAA
jgi:hypothetical protein